MSEVTKLEWMIMDSLSDDYETVPLILNNLKYDFHNISQKVVEDTVYKLFQRGLVQEINHKEIYLQTIIAERAGNDDNVYWFGL